MKRIFLLLVAAMLIGTACAAKEDNNASNQEVPQPIEVEILTPRHIGSREGSYYRG